MIFNYDGNFLCVAPNIDRDEDILMIQYADHETENDSLPMVRRTENIFTIPLFDETSNSNDQTGIVKSCKCFVVVVFAIFDLITLLHFFCFDSFNFNSFAVALRHGD